MNLTFGEQIRILLNRENMTIKALAEQLERVSGVPCSRQNLTQKLKRDNFQEQDMRELAALLGYDVQITLVPLSTQAKAVSIPVAPVHVPTIPVPDAPKVVLPPPTQAPATVFSDAELLPPDCINPLTGEEYQTNTARSHPVLAQFVQVYDRTEHTWTDISEDYFLKFQEQKRKILGKDYIPPIYI